MFKKKYNLKQSDLGNAGQVSQVEKGKRQVIASILLYLNTQTDLDYKEIIFGDIAKFVEYNLNVLDFPRHSQISIFKEKCFGF